MSAQTRTKNLPYKILVLLLRSCTPGTCTVLYVGFTDWLAGLSVARVKVAITPAFLHPQDLHQPTHMKFLRNPSSTLYRAAKYTRCLNTISTIMSIVLILMCGIPIRWPTRGLKFWPGYLHSNPRDGTTTSKLVGSTRWVTGFYKLRNIGVGLLVFMWVDLMVQPCFATEVRGLARPSSGEREDSRGRKVLLISCDVSSLVIDTLCQQAVGGNTAVACIYFDFAAQEEQSPASVLGAVLKQVVSGLDEIPERIVKAFRDREKAIGGQRLALVEIVGFLQDISSSRRIFVCVDALDECQPGHRVKLLDSLNQVLQNSPGARIFLTGRPYIRGEVERHLAGAATRSITPTKDDIIIFLRAKLKEDTMPDAMDESLSEEIMRDIPKTVSEM